MPATRRLYYEDSHLIEFEATVVDQTERVSDWTAVTLDQTAFYPTGGGQPSDTGTLDGKTVVECIDNEDEGVLHVIKGRAPEIGAKVRGRVDWSRRLDHMQQHTGQHILSQAFVTLLKAPTRSFRVLEESCEIDVDLANPSNEVIERAVELANNVIWEDRTITIRNVTSEEAAQLPLRKDPARQGELRLIDIEGFDLTPCGGTHAYRTGEVGIIAVRHWERAKGLTRIEFVAGTRALADYRRANKTARAVAGLYSAARDDAAKLTARVLDENKELHRRVRMLEEIAARVEAEELLSNLDREAVDETHPELRTHSDEVEAVQETHREWRTQHFDNREAVQESSRGLSAQRFDDREAVQESGRGLSAQRSDDREAVQESSRGLSAQRFDDREAVQESSRGLSAQRSDNLEAVQESSRGLSAQRFDDREAVQESSRGLSAQRDTPGSDRIQISDPGGVTESAHPQVRVVTRIFDNRDAESLKHLAQALIANSRVIALLGSRDGDTARLVFARSEDAPGDMNALMREACAMLDGRGGGKPDMAQGGGKNVDSLEAAIAHAMNLIS